MISEKLLLLQQIKQDIINAIEEKGVNVNTNDFTKIADLIRSMSGGNGDGLSFIGVLHTIDREPANVINIIDRNAGSEIVYTIDNAAINGPGFLNIVKEK